MTTANIEIRGLTENDYDMLKNLQEQPDNDFELCEFIGEDLDEEPSSYGYGLFIDGVLAAQCSIGGAEEIADSIEFDNDSPISDNELLSDVYVRPEYRNNGLAHKIIDYAINDESHRNSNIYCMPYADIEDMYRHMGFEDVTDGVLVIKRH